ncbi:TPA: hypothetical protein ACVU5P_004228 [Vibrio parahaemolyticus]
MRKLTIDEMHSFLMSRDEVTKITTTQQKGGQATLFIGFKYSSKTIKGDTLEDCFKVAMKPHLELLHNEKTKAL